MITSCSEPIQLSPDAVLPDGGVYQGDIQAGLFHGQGTLKYRNGMYYQGLFQNGLYHGEGLLVYEDGSSYQGVFNKGEITGHFIFKNLRDESTYEGDLVNGLMHGEGTISNETYTYKGNFKDGFFNGNGKITYSNGISYEGEFQNSLYHGKGIFFDEDGSRYEGEFKDNYYNGEGTFTSETYTYEGNFKDGYLNGKGTITYSVGISYKGQFKKGQYHGKGIFIDEDGSRYEGEFKDNYYHGEGRYSHNETWYKGDFKEGELAGEGEYLDANGSYYKGEILGWLAHGVGELKNSDGALLKGMFEYGSLEGVGEQITADGSHYKGDFKYSHYDGDGILTKSNGDIYEGEFSFGSYHGQGTLSSLNTETGDNSVITGRWRRGKLVHNNITGDKQHSQAEFALEKHQMLVKDVLSNLAVSGTETNVYFLGVAGDGSQSVFRREIEFVSKQIEQRYGTQQRSVNLINHHDSAEIYPMATRRSIASAISSIAEKMNIDKDILFIYLTSHGSKNYDFYLNHDSIQLPDISPKELKKMLNESQVKWRVIMVSACYSGGFIPELEDEYTLVMTAADAKSQSFGCSEESEMTYFGKAFFKEVFANNANIDLVSAFSDAKDLIRKWEKEQKLDASNPMISAPSKIVKKMAEL